MYAKDHRNIERAARGLSLLARYPEADDARTALVDLLSDMMHAIGPHEVEACVNTAHEHHQAEEAGED